MPVPSSRLSLSETLAMVLEAREAALAKALPGTVVSYDVGSQSATVRPGVHRLVTLEDDYEEDEIEILPAIPNVPVMWPQGRGFSFIGSLNPGDPVLLICCDRDISAWFSSGVPSAPEDTRSHSWSSAVAVPGLIHAHYTNAPGDALALASKVEAEFNRVWKALSAHTHAANGTVPAAVAPPSPAFNATLIANAGSPSITSSDTNSSIAKVSS